MKRTPLTRKTPLRRKRATPRRVKATCEKRGCKRPPISATLLLCRHHAKQEADRLFSLAVRSRGACESCGTREDLQAAHICSRRYASVRHSLDNAFCLCRAHHLLYTLRPLEWDEFVTSKIGAEAYADLKRRALTATKPDYEAILRRLRG